MDIRVEFGRRAGFIVLYDCCWKTGDWWLNLFIPNKEDWLWGHIDNMEEGVKYYGFGPLALLTVRKE